MALGAKLRFAVILLIAIAGPGFANYILSTNGFQMLGTVIWWSGYGFGILAIWHIWIRPLDFSNSVT
jgi:hypothetical protein